MNTKIIIPLAIDFFDIFEYVSARRKKSQLFCHHREKMKLQIFDLHNQNRYLFSLEPSGNYEGYVSHSSRNVRSISSTTCITCYSGMESFMQTFWLSLM